jgi:hypothetical protein
VARQLYSASHARIKQQRQALLQQLQAVMAAYSSMAQYGSDDALSNALGERACGGCVHAAGLLRASGAFIACHSQCTMPLVNSRVLNNAAVCAGADVCMCLLNSVIVPNFSTAAHSSSMAQYGSDDTLSNALGGTAATAKFAPQLCTQHMLRGCCVIKTARRTAGACRDSVLPAVSHKHDTPACG